jgi:hypothetical protein
MKIFSSKKRVTAIGVVTAATLIGGGMAYAYWTTTGSGTGSAATGTSTAYTVNFDNPFPVSLTPLTPAGPAQLHHVSVINPGTGAQRITTVTVKIGSGPGAWSVLNANGTCSDADFEVEDWEGNWGPSAQILDAPTTLLGTGDPADRIELPVNVRMKDTGAPQNGCKALTALNAVPLYASVG